MITGLDIVIPAHYHGSTVGVTIAFMGLSYYLLTRLGFGKLPAKMARWQPYLYGGGQLIHITGLAWSGGYGVQRKTAGTARYHHPICQITAQNEIDERWRKLGCTNQFHNSGI